MLWNQSEQSKSSSDINQSFHFITPLTIEKLQSYIADIQQEGATELFETIQTLPLQVIDIKSFFSFLAQLMKASSIQTRLVLLNITRYIGRNYPGSSSLKTRALAQFILDLYSNTNEEIISLANSFLRELLKNSSSTDILTEIVRSIGISFNFTHSNFLDFLRDSLRISFFDPNVFLDFPFFFEDALKSSLPAISNSAIQCLSELNNYHSATYQKLSSFLSPQSNLKVIQYRRIPTTNHLPYKQTKSMSQHNHTLPRHAALQITNHSLMNQNKYNTTFSDQNSLSFADNQNLAHLEIHSLPGDISSISSFQSDENSNDFRGNTFQDNTLQDNNYHDSFITKSDSINSNASIEQNTESNIMIASTPNSSKINSKKRVSSFSTVPYSYISTIETFKENGSDNDDSIFLPQKRNATPNQSFLPKTGIDFGLQRKAMRSSLKLETKHLIPDSMPNLDDFEPLGNNFSKTTKPFRARYLGLTDISKPKSRASNSYTYPQVLEKLKSSEWSDQNDVILYLTNNHELFSSISTDLRPFLSHLLLCAKSLRTILSKNALILLAEIENDNQIQLLPVLDFLADELLQIAPSSKHFIADLVKQCFLLLISRVPPDKSAEFFNKQMIKKHENIRLLISEGILSISKKVTDYSLLINPLTNLILDGNSSVRKNAKEAIYNISIIHPDFGSFVNVNVHSLTEKQAFFNAINSKPC